MFDEYDEYDEYDDDSLNYENITVNMRLSANYYENIAIMYFCIRQYFKNISIIFNVASFDFYNFEYIPIVFYAEAGGLKYDIPVSFYAVRAPQNFASYIMQKLYSVVSPYGPSQVNNILDWNVKPNKTWYVSVNYPTVILYDTEADLFGATNPVAIGTADENLGVVLYYTDDEYDSLEFYYQDADYHLTLLSGSCSGDYKIKPLTDLPEIRHSIYNNKNIVELRGEAELELHTNVVIKKEHTLGVHLPTLAAGDVIYLTSARRGKEERSQVLSHTIAGETSEGGETSLISSLEVANYMELYK